MKITYRLLLGLVLFVFQLVGSQTEEIKNSIIIPIVENGNVEVTELNLSNESQTEMITIKRKQQNLLSGFTFDQPINARAAPFITTQLNFGSGNNLVAARMEIFAMTGVDDDSSLPTKIIALLGVENSQRTRQQVQTLYDYFAVTC